AVDKFRSFAADKGLSPATLALAWILNRNGTHIPIPGTRSADHLSECAAASSIILTEDDLIEIERLLPVGFAHGDRYSEAQLGGAERYC
ncbi:MAG: aldo/keto reductase, partial [Sneathiella sp.]